MKNEIRIFVSYAHKNKETAMKFTNEFKEYINASKSYKYAFWSDIELLPGVEWETEIRERMKSCHCCILLVSPSFLISKYIREVELPTLEASNKVIIPIALHKINFQHHDLHDLEKYQIFRLSSDLLL